MTTNPDPFDTFFGAGASPFGPQHAGAAAFARGFVQPKDESGIPDWRKRLASRVRCNAYLIEAAR